MHDDLHTDMKITVFGQKKALKFYSFSANFNGCLRKKTNQNPYVPQIDEDDYQGQSATVSVIL